MYNFKSEIGYGIEINLEEGIEIINNEKNLEMLSIKLKLSIFDTRKLLKELQSKGLIKNYLLNQYLPWTEQEDAQLDIELSENLTIKEISKKHGRTVNSIMSRIKRHEISKNEEKLINIIEQDLKNTNN